MSTINLPALGRVTFDEIGRVLSWLEAQPGTQARMSMLEKESPIRVSELRPALKVLQQFRFVVVTETAVSLAPPGRDYLRADAANRKWTLRLIFERLPWVQALLAKLNAAPSGRLPRWAINEAIDGLDASPRNRVAESEVIGFIGWAECCELFLFDEKRQELIRLESRNPRDPRPVTPTLPLAS